MMEDDRRQARDRSRKKKKKPDLWGLGKKNEWKRAVLAISHEASALDLGIIQRSGTPDSQCKMQCHRP